MRILVVGLGVIGSTYGYLFHTAGHKVEHLIRECSKNIGTKELTITILDGRENAKGNKMKDIYSVNHYKAGESYDFIFISVPEGKIKSVLDLLEQKQIQGTIVLSCGIWDTHANLQKIMKGWDYILGYPVAGGNINGTELQCCVFDHFMLEGKEKARIHNYDELIRLLSECKIKIENPYDMLEWIWIHMAINAGVISTAGKYGEITNTSIAAEQLMDSAKELSEAVVSIRETSKIIATRGISLKNYRNELLPYRIPSKLAGIVMKKMFAGNLLTRKIMTLHNNLDDLLFVCGKVYECGRENKVNAPIFYSNYLSIREKLVE